MTPHEYLAYSGRQSTPDHLLADTVQADLLRAAGRSEHVVSKVNLAKPDTNQLENIAVRGSIPVNRPETHQQREKQQTQ